MCNFPSLIQNYCTVSYLQLALIIERNLWRTVIKNVIIYSCLELKWLTKNLFKEFYSKVCKILLHRHYTDNWQVLTIRRDFCTEVYFSAFFLHFNFNWDDISNIQDSGSPHFWTPQIPPAQHIFNSLLTDLKCSKIRRLLLFDMLHNADECTLLKTNCYPFEHIWKRTLTIVHTWRPTDNARYNIEIIMVVLNFLIKRDTNPAWKIYVLKNTRNTTMIAKIMHRSWILSGGKNTTSIRSQITCTAHQRYKEWI